MIIMIIIVIVIIIIIQLLMKAEITQKSLTFCCIKQKLGQMNI